MNILAETPRQTRLFVIDGPEEFRVATDAYRRADVFQAELHQVFYANWIYLCHESELPEPGSFKSTWIGLQPVIVARDESGEINAFLNFCRHRGAALCREEYGKTSRFVCPYHGWSYRLSGALAGIVDRERFPKNFRMDDKGLIPVPRLARHGGLVFGSFNREIESFESYLGEAKTHLDLWLGRQAGGRYRINGAHKYAYHGNWKFQAENVCDGYHANFVHRSAYNTFRKFDNFTNRHYGAVRKIGQTRGYPGGHGVIEAGTPLENRFVDPEIRKTYFDDLVGLHGEEKAHRILENRHLLIFPSVVLMDSNLRVIQPRAHDYTEVYSYPMIVDGVPAEISSGRLLDVQTRVGVAGILQADDVEVFNANQTALQGLGAEWINLSRGYDLEEQRPSGERVGAFSDETPQRAFWRRWQALMGAAML